MHHSPARDAAFRASPHLVGYSRGLKVNATAGPNATALVALTSSLPFLPM